MAAVAQPTGNRRTTNLAIALLWKFGQLVLVLWIISTLLFFLIRLTGDPAELLAGENARPENIERIRQAYGLADPLPVQYINFLLGAIRLDFGLSVQSNTPAMPAILARFPATALLAFSSLALALVIAIPLGTLAALKRGKFIDRAISVLVALGQSIPAFVFGLLLIFFFAVNLKWLPTFGDDNLRYLILPMITLSLGFIALLTRLVRSNLLEVLNQDFIRTARSKGLANVTVIWRHALRNTMLSLLTVLGLNLANLLGGALIVERLFAWRGMGSKIADAIAARDFPVVQAGVFMVALIVFTVNALVDFLYTLADPRVRKR